MQRLLLAFALPMVLSAQASAHALWAQSRSPEGYSVFYGEVDDNVGDSLIGWQSSHLDVWAAENKSVATRVLVTQVEIQTTAKELRFSYRHAPVHGDGTDAGRAEFYARVVSPGMPTKDSVQLPLDLRINAQGQMVLLRQGQPLPDWDYSCRAGSGKATEAKTDRTGRLQLPATTKNDIVCAAWIEMNNGGVWQGKTYSKTWYVITLTIGKLGGQ